MLGLHAMIVSLMVRIAMHTHNLSTNYTQFVCVIHTNMNRLELCASSLFIHPWGKRAQLCIGGISGLIFPS